MLIRNNMELINAILKSMSLDECLTAAEITSKLIEEGYRHKKLNKKGGISIFMEYNMVHKYVDKITKPCNIYVYRRKF